MSNSQSTLAVIPARYASTRFPGKPLVEIDGKSMIQRVYAQAVQADFQRVVVATDDARIYKHVQSWGGDVVMTCSDHPSGTDRVAEVAATFPEFPFVVNVQGDEPFLDPNHLNVLITALKSGDVPVATLVSTIADRVVLQNPNVVKVVRNALGEALYFSRYPVPFIRNGSEAALQQCLDSGLFLRHIGLYGFRREALMAVQHLPVSPLEQAESLEQLRWLEAGWRIQAALVMGENSPAIDSPADWNRITGLAGDPKLME